MHKSTSLPQQSCLQLLVCRLLDVCSCKNDICGHYTHQQLRCSRRLAILDHMSMLREMAGTETAWNMKEV